jgi:hypothetical protein
MEIFIAILFYLQILMPGTSYTQADINAMIQANQPAIMQVQTNPNLMNTAITDYNTAVDKGIVEPWEEEQEPIQE